MECICNSNLYLCYNKPMTLMPTIGTDLTKPETHSEAFIASRVVFIPMTVNGRTVLISAADDEPEHVEVYISAPRRVGFVDEIPTGAMSLMPVFA